MGICFLALLATAAGAIHELHPDDFTGDGAPRVEIFRQRARLFVDFSQTANAGDNSEFHEVFRKIEERMGAATDFTLARLDCGRHVGYCRSIHNMRPWSVLRLYFKSENNHLYFPLSATRPPQPRGAPPMQHSQVVDTAAHLMHTFAAAPDFQKAKAAIMKWVDMQRDEARSNFVLPEAKAKPARKKMSARLREWVKGLFFGREEEPDLATRSGQTLARERRFAQARAEKILTTNRTGNVTEDAVQRRADAARRSAADNATSPLSWAAAMMGAGLDLILHLNNTNYKTLLAPVAHAEGAPEMPRQVFLLYVGSWTDCRAEMDEMRFAMSYLREMAWGLATLAVANCDLFQDPCIDGDVSSYCTASHFTTRSADRTVLGRPRAGVPMSPDQFKGQFTGTRVRDMVIDELPKHLRRLTRADVNEIEADRARSIAKMNEEQAKRAPVPAPAYRIEDIDPKTIEMLRKAVSQQIQEVNEPGGPLDGAMKERAFKAMARGVGLGVPLGGGGGGGGVPLGGGGGRGGPPRGGAKPPTPGGPKQPEL